MRVIITGSPGFLREECRNLLSTGIDIARHRGIEITEVICSEDRCGTEKHIHEWAREKGLFVRTFFADFGRNRAMASHMRNQEMIGYGEALIAITTGSTGTEHLIQMAQHERMPVMVIST